VTGGSGLYGCIEAGGTKFVVGIVDRDRVVLDRARFATTTPEETLGAVERWLVQAQQKFGALSALGIASFGPIELNRGSETWGYITDTPKPGWRGTNFGQRFQTKFGLPVGFDTDVNGAALAEARWGAGRAQAVSAYITVGTGIGGGVILGGTPHHGLSHPEMGHLRPPRHVHDQDFPGSCPFHRDCYEGLISGPAIEARWGVSLSQLPSDHPAHEIVAWYLGHLTIALQGILEPGRIIMGGGVMETPGLLSRVQKAATLLGSGYFRGKPDEIIVAPELGDQIGLLAGLALAMDAFGEPSSV